jgi:AcrR family transcriptional regulator
MGRPSTREKLLDTAESLFADHGLGGVSLRAINAEAGLSPAALHYHFGTQRALVEALLERHMPQLMERRGALLDEIADGARPTTTRGILSALVRPQVELLAEGGDSGLRYMRFVRRLQADDDLDPSFVLERWPGSVDRLVPLLQQANPALPLKLVEFRLSLAIDVMLSSLARQPSPTTAELGTYASALLDFLTGAFEAPAESQSD